MFRKNPLETLIYEAEDIFSNTKTLLNIYFIFPVTRASAGKSFSSLKRLKSCFKKFNW